MTAADVQRYLPFISDPSCIYYSGSVALGWHHARSDLDIYVVTNSKLDLGGAAGQHWTIDIDAEPPTVQFIQGALGPFRAHVMFWLEEQIDAVIDRLPQPDNLASVYGLSNADWDFVYKVAIAKPLVGEEWLVMRQRRVAASGLARGLAYWSAAAGYSLLEDIEGFLLSGDVESAVVAAQEAVRQTVDAMLFATGDVTKIQKWRARRVRAIAPAGLSFDEYWRLETAADLDLSDPSKWVRRTARRCQALLIQTTQKLDAAS